MAEKAKKNNKNLIIGICATVLVIGVVAVAIFFATRGGSTTLNDAYFVSDDTKYVLTVDSDQTDSEDETLTPIKTHIVYNYSGDSITGMTTYMEFADAATAKSALEIYKNAEDQTGVKNISVNGKYVVVEMTEDQYAEMTASDVKQQIEFMEMLKNMNLNDVEDDSDNSVEIDETTEENEK
ncbi:MAG: hypothetical protein Q4C24_02500 [Candidatus Saccharibacteria bacterium]|nr:hypothetical protein [Candidatus Saccharibacteria bacterium]